MTEVTPGTVSQEADAPKPGTPEYDAAMAAKFREAKGKTDNPFTQELTEQKPAEGEQKPQRPENVPEKFWDAEKGVVNTEALLKSYGELEKKGVEKKPDEKPAGEENKSEEQGAVENAVKAAGLDPDKLGETIIASGDITDADYAAFEKLGFGRDFVKGVVDALVYRRDAAKTEAVTYIGGEEQANELLQWASKSLKPEEIDGYNTMLAGPQWKVAVDTLKSLRAQSGKTAGEPALRGGNSLGGGPVVGFQSKDEMKAAMQDPLYFEQSPKGNVYRTEVYRKIATAAWNRR